MEVLIEPIEHSIAYTLERNGQKIIQVNKNLKNYPNLYKKVMIHEMYHINSKNKRMDFWFDLKESLTFGGSNKELIKFMLKNPKSLWSLSPITLDEKDIGFNLFNFAIWGMLSITLITIGVLL